MLNIISQLKMNCDMVGERIWIRINMSLIIMFSIRISLPLGIRFAEIYTWGALVLALSWSKDAYVQ